MLGQDDKAIYTGWQLTKNCSLILLQLGSIKNNRSVDSSGFPKTKAEWG